MKFLYDGYLSFDDYVLRDAWIKTTDDFIDKFYITNNTFFRDVSATTVLIATTHPGDADPYADFDKDAGAGTADTSNNADAQRVAQRKGGKMRYQQIDNSGGGQGNSANENNGGEITIIYEQTLDYLYLSSGRPMDPVGFAKDIVTTPFRSIDNQTEYINMLKKNVGISAKLDFVYMSVGRQGSYFRAPMNDLVMVISPAKGLFGNDNEKAEFASRWELTVRQHMDSYYNSQEKWAAIFNFSSATTVKRMLHDVESDVVEIEYEQDLNYMSLFTVDYVIPKTIAIDPFTSAKDKQEFMARLGPNFVGKSIPCLDDKRICSRTNNDDEYLDDAVSGNQNANEKSATLTFTDYLLMIGLPVVASGFFLFICISLFCFTDTKLICPSFLLQAINPSDRDDRSSKVYLYADSLDYDDDVNSNDISLAPSKGFYDLDVDSLGEDMSDVSDNNISLKHTAYKPTNSKSIYSEDEFGTQRSVDSILRTGGNKGSTDSYPLSFEKRKMNTRVKKVKKINRRDSGIEDSTDNEYNSSAGGYNSSAGGSDRYGPSDVSSATSCAIDEINPLNNPGNFVNIKGEMYFLSDRAERQRRVSFNLDHYQNDPSEAESSSPSTKGYRGKAAFSSEEEQDVEDMD